MKNKQLMKDVCKFMSLVPENILIEQFANISYRNRSDRRSFEKIKSMNNKLEKLLNEPYYCMQLIKLLYLVYCKEQSEYSEKDYNKILKSINRENYISKIIYILYLCKDEAFYNLYFEEFIKSELFQNAKNNDWKYELMQEEKERNKMTYYLGLIELRNTFYNFKPLYIYDVVERNVVEIDDNELKEEFPLYGTINLAYEMHHESHHFLNKLNIYNNNPDQLFLYVLKISMNEIEDNGNEKITKKVDLQKLYDNNVKLSDRIFSISELNIFRIVTPKDTINNNSFSNMIVINEKESSKSEKVLLQYARDNNNRYYGPYELQERSIDGEKYIRPDSGTYKYVLKYYNEEDLENIYLEYGDLEALYVNIKHPAHDGDVIPDDMLLKKFTESINKDDLYSDPEEFQRRYSTSPFLANIPEGIRVERINRIKTIIKNTSNYETIKDEIINSFISRLDNKVFDILGERIKESSVYKELQKNAENLQIRLNDLESKKYEIEEANLKIERLQEELKKKDNEIEEIKSQQTKVQTADAEFEVEKLKTKIKELSEEKNKLEREVRAQNEEYDRRVLDCDKKKRELDNIQNGMQLAIKEQLKEADVNKMLSKAFDPYISNAMIEAAGNYKFDEEQKIYKTIVEETMKTDCSEMEKDELINLLVGGIQKFRKYSKNDIINMFICIAQNFITIFSGEPGTGKTSICNIIACSLGLNKFGYENNICKNRYIPVSVERGWSSKRDLIGYYNPLTKKYDRSNSKIYDGLMILNEEREESRFPYLILLDEANLSPIEYYWADFMRIADNSYENSVINIGTETDIYIPKTLHFLATINNDQTTEQLSPRLIDRAWIIKLPKVPIIESEDDISKLFQKPILWDDLKKVFVAPESNEMTLHNLAEQIYDLFDEHNLTVSPRVRRSIKNYVCVAQDLMEDEIGTCSKKEKALDFAILQKLLPKINGYYKDYERLFNSLMQICDENHLKMTNDALKAMQELGMRGMGYCQYLT